MAWPHQSSSEACTVSSAPWSPLCSRRHCRNVGGATSLDALPPFTSPHCLPGLLTSLSSPVQLFYRLWLTLGLLWLPGFIPAFQTPQWTTNTFQQSVHHISAGAPCNSLISGQSPPPHTHTRSPPCCIFQKDLASPSSQMPSCLCTCFPHAWNSSLCLTFQVSAETSVVPGKIADS